MYAPFLILFGKLFLEYTPLNLGSFHLFLYLLMDEKVIVNLGFFFTSAPFACTYYSIAFNSARYAPFTSPHYTLAFGSTPTLPFPPVNKLPNKLAPNVPSNILKNPSLYSLDSFLIVLLTPFNKIPELSRALIIFIISFMSSCSIVNLTSEP